MYDQSSITIAAVLFISLVIVIELGYRIGRSEQRLATEHSRAHVNTIQASLLGVLALLLAFTLSLSLQRFDSRSEAVIDEANAIGTAYLRIQLLPASIQSEARSAITEYLALRVNDAAFSTVDQPRRAASLVESKKLQDALWLIAVKAAALDDRPVTSGLFIQSVNELIDSNTRRSAALDRHVPELVLFLLFAAFLLTGGIVGYAAGIAGHRASFVTYILIALIVLLVFIVVDLDRPRRGLIEVDSSSLIDLQTSITAVPVGAPPPVPAGGP